MSSPSNIIHLLFQAFHEELTRKAADLASENETLKRVCFIYLYIYLFFALWLCCKECIPCFVVSFSASQYTDMFSGLSNLIFYLVVLQKSKELAVKEFQSLQTTNQNLKGQVQYISNNMKYHENSLYAFYTN